MTQVLLSHLTKRYSAPRKAVDDLSLEIPTGELTALLGPSGCGKTTILKMIAGLLPPTAGDILFDGETVLSIPAERRGAVMVFQNHLLFPYMTVGENVAFGLRMRGEPAHETRRKVAEMLDLVQLTGYEKRKPGQLSGGQQQRVALARALVVEPRVLLLDEPLSNLDARLRDEMRELLHGLQRQQRITTLVVTHDQEEAVMLGDNLALIMDGVLQQVAEPHVFFECPATLEVARFFGANNVLTGFVRDSVIHTSVGTLRAERNHLPPGPVQLAIRPEAIHILSGQHPDGNTILAAVESCAFAGVHSRLRVRAAETTLEVVADAAAARLYREGDRLQLYLPPEMLWAFEGEPDRQGMRNAEP